MPTLSADYTYYVDLSADYEFSTYTSVYPEELAFDHQIRGIGNVSFQLSYSALDQDGALAVPSKDFIGPYRSYWRLRFGDTCIMAGVITKTNSKYGTDFMSIFGKTWEHLFEKWQYPFDPRTAERTPGVPSSAPIYDYVFPNSFQNDELIGSGTPTPQGLIYQAYNRDVISILSDILAQTMSAVPHRVPIDLSSLVGLSGTKTKYQFALGDTTTMDSFIGGLAEIGNGFDWWISWDKKFMWASPYRYGNPSAPFLFYSFDVIDTQIGFLSDIEFSNNGPVATHVLGTGAGLASQTTLGSAYGESTNQTQFSRLDMSYDFGDVRNRPQLVAKVRKQLSHDLNPEHEIPVTVDPSHLSTFWADFRVGRAFWINLDMGYHLIDSAQQLKSFSGRVDRNGNATVDLAIEQIYDTIATAGTVEG